jgi:hypothetical protein
LAARTATYLPDQAEQFETRPRTAPPPVERTAPQRVRVETGAAPATGHAHRTSFVLLLLGLLGGGMVCLLVVNTTLAANSIQIGKLQQRNANVSEQVQELRQQVTTARSAGAIEAEARKLGLRPDPHLVFLDLHSKRIVAQPGQRAMPAVRSAHRPGPGSAGRTRHPAGPDNGRTAAGRTAAGKTTTGKTTQGGTGQ